MTNSPPDWASLSRNELELEAANMHAALEQLRQDFKDAMRLVRATNFNQEKNDADPQQHQRNT